MSIKKTRLKHLQEICDQRRKDYLKGFVGTTQSVLVERSHELHSYGLTQQYIEVELDRVNEGTVVDVVINRSEDILYGKVRDSNE
jgi:tRNA A37 methylthiotransferase MiaB